MAAGSGKLVVEFSGDDNKLLKSLNTLERRVDKLTGALAKSGKEGQAAGQKSKTGMDAAGAAAQRAGNKIGAAGKKGKMAFGPTAAGELKTYAARMVGLSAAAGVLAKALAAANDERQRAKELAKTEVAATGQLAQLAGGDPERLRGLLGEVKKTRLQTGMGPEAAARLQFMLTSLGEERQRRMFASFQNIADPAELAKGAKTIQSAFGKPETGTTRSIVNKMLQASAISKAAVGEFAPAATIAAKTAKTIGATDEEMLTILAVLSKAAKSIDVGGTQLEALGAIIDKRGLGGRGYLAAIPEIRERLKGLSPKETQEFFGRKEALKGYRNIRDAVGEIAREMLKVEAAGRAAVGKGLATTVPESYLAVGKFATAREAAIAQQRRQIAEEGGPAEIGLTIETLRSRQAARSIERGESPFTRAMRQMVTGAAAYLPWVDPTTVRQYGEGVTALFNPTEIFRDLLEASGTLRDAAGKLDAAADKQRRTGGGVVRPGSTPSAPLTGGEE